MIRVRFLVILSLLSAFVSACSAPVQKSRLEEEAEVYSFLLNSDPVHYLDHSPTLIVGNSTVIYDNPVLDPTWSLKNETIIDFQQATQESQPITIRLSTDRPNALVDNEILLTLAPNGDWPEIEAKYPGTNVVTYFSGIGFNDDFTQALVYMEHYCGGECATGNLFFLVYDRNGWKIKHIISSWIS